MVENFKRDVKRAKIAEINVLELFNQLNIFEDYEFKNVTDVKECWHKGDIEVTDFYGNTLYVDVKDDSCIGKTQNVLCEERVYYYSNNKVARGFMYSDYDWLAVYSKDKKEVYLLDFNILKQIYKLGNYRSHMIQPNSRDQHSEVYLLPLSYCKKYGAWKYTIHFDLDDEGVISVGAVDEIVQTEKQKEKAERYFDKKKQKRIFAA